MFPGMYHRPPLEKPRTTALWVHDPDFAARPLREALLAEGFAVLEFDGPEAPLAERLGSTEGTLGGEPTGSAVRLVVAQGRAANGLLRGLDALPNAEALILLSSDVEPSTCDVLAHWNRPLLVLHSVADERVSLARAETVFQAASQPKSFLTLEHGGHLLEDAAAAAQAARLAATWAAPRWPTEDRAPHEKDHHGDVTVSFLGDGMAHLVHAPPHHLVSDEPPDLGGQERGPNPYDLLLAALGACTAMTVRMYANLKKWPLEGMSVRLRHARIHAKDCEDCETKEGMVDRIEREIQFSGPLSSEQLDRLMEIANKCPVHRTLSSETKIPTTRLS